MNIAILGTGIVGQTLASSLANKGQSVMIGTRNVNDALAKPGNEVMGAPPFAQWHEANPRVQLGTFAEAAAFGEILFNVTSGGASVAALEAAGEENLNGKVLIDVANPLDFSKGFPPTLSISNDDSLAETIQRRFPELKVVKALNTMTASVMVNPAMIPGEHHVFISGDDASSKTVVSTFLTDQFGWKNTQILDLGDITTARGSEQLLPIWIRLYGALKTPIFNFSIVRG